MNSIIQLDNIIKVCWRLLRKNFFLFAFIFFLNLLCTSVSFAQTDRGSSSDDSLRFKFAFVAAYNEGGGEWTINESSGGPSAIKHLYVFIKPLSDCFIYVFLFDSDGKVNLVFPEREIEFGWLRTNRERYIVPILERIDKLTYYILVSPFRLNNIENAFQLTRLKNPAKNIDYVKAFKNKVRKIFRQSADSLTKIAEIPYHLAGSRWYMGKARPSELDISQNRKKGTSFENLDFEKYTKTITTNKIFIHKLDIKLP